MRRQFRRQLDRVIGKELFKSVKQLCAYRPRTLADDENIGIGADQVRAAPNS